MPSNTSAEVSRGQMPQVPLTIEGSSVLHQMMRFRWSEWRKLSETERNQIVGEAVPVFAQMERATTHQSALFSLLGHKGDLLFVHFRHSFDELNHVELQMARLRLWDYLEP